MKRTTALLLTLIISTLVNAQVLKSIGIKGGVSIANQTWEYYPSNIINETKNTAGIYSALSLEFFQSKYLSLITDIGYCQKGFVKEIGYSGLDWQMMSDTTNKTYDTKFNYFTLSPMLKARYEKTPLAIYVLLGLRMDYYLSYKSDFNYEPLDKYFNKEIAGANLGAGLECKIKHFGVFLEGQYQHDFTKVRDTDGLEIKNMALIINMGLKYYLTKKDDAK